MKIRKARLRTVVTSVALATATLLAASACAVDPVSPPTSSPAGAPTVRAELAAPVTVLRSTDPAELALAASQTFFAQAPVVVLASVDDERGQATGAAAAVELTAPLLLVGGAISDDGVRSDLDRLGARAVVLVGDEGAVPTTGDRTVVRLESWALREGAEALDPDDLDEVLDALPDLGASEVLHEVLALVEGGDEQLAAVATARAAGVVPLEVPGGDPLASGETVRAIAAAKPLAVVGIGPGFGTVEDLAWRVLAAETAEELPGGGQLVADKQFVTVQRSAVTSFLTELPEEERAARVQAARDGAAALAEATGADVVPTLEVPVSLVSASPGEDGNFSTELAVDVVRPLVEAAADAGVYVLLAFQPGRGTFLQQVEQYDDLLALPGVGVALDVKNRSAGEGVLVGGTVGVDEVDAAVAHVAELTRTRGLPQKLVVVHQRTAATVDERERLDTSRPEVEIVLHADVVGDRWTRESAYEALRADAPEGVAWGTTHPAGWYGEAEIEPLLALDPAPAYLRLE